MCIRDRHTTTSSVSDPGHSHNYQSATANENCIVGGGRAVQAFTANTSTSTTGISVNVSVAATGEDATDKNLPPYTGLYYIIRIK